MFSSEFSRETKLVGWQGVEREWGRVRTERKKERKKKRQIDLKKLAYVIIETGKFKTCRVDCTGWRPREELMLQFESESRLLTEFFPPK